MEYTIELNNMDDTKKLANSIVTNKFLNMILCLDGDLGSGKTALTRFIGEFLNIRDTITSPTFTIIKEYEDGILSLYHMDVYRLEGNTYDIGIEEYFYKNGIVVIEWADTIKDILPNNRLDIKFKVVNENKRILTLIPHGKKYEELCEAII